MARTLTRRTRRDVEDYDEPETTTDTKEDEDDERPARGRSRVPARRGRGTDDEDEKPRRPRRRPAEDDDDEEEAPRVFKTSRTGTAGRGWGAFEKKRTEHSDFVKNFQLPEQATLIKILEDEPFAVYAEHWLDDRKGKKSFVCLDEDCPLCDFLGDKPRVFAMFNILDLTDPDNPVVSPWKVSQTVTDVLKDFSKDKKTSPLNRVDLYWSIWKSGGGKKGRVQTNLTPVKERDLEEDWEFDQPFTQEELDEFKLFEEADVLQFSTKKELKAIASEYDD